MNPNLIEHWNSLPPIPCPLAQPLPEEVRENVQTRLALLKEPANGPLENIFRHSLVRGLENALRLILETREPVDPAFVALIQKLSEKFTLGISQDPGGADEADLRQCVRQIETLTDLYQNKINPTQVKTFKGKRLGDYLIDLKFVTKEQVETAVALQNTGPYAGKRMGDILQQQGLLTRAQLDQAIEQQMVDNLES